MTVREYIGARYIPLFSDPIEWSADNSYEPLVVVTYQGASYVSRQSVPPGIELTNGTFWVKWADYNAQLQSYINRVDTFDGRIEDNSDAIAAFNEELGQFEENTNAAIAAEAQKRKDADEELKEKIDNTISHLFVPPLITNMEVVQRHEEQNQECVNGGCAFILDENVYFIFVITKSPDTEGATIYLTDYNGNILTSTITDKIGHGQNVTYVDGVIYIPNTNYPNPQSSGTAFAKFNVTLNSITYIGTESVPGVDVLFDATLDKDFYYVRNYSKIQKINRTNGNIVAETTLEKLKLPNVGNGLFLAKNLHALCTTNNGPNRLVLLDMDTLECKGTINIAESFGYVNMFEIEWGSFIGNELYLGNHSGYNSSVKSDTNIAIFTILKTDIFNQKGMSCFNGDIRADGADSAMTSITLDFQNAPRIPNDYENSRTFKYPQDITGLIRTYNKMNAYDISVISRCPIPLVLNNYFGIIRIIEDGGLSGLRVQGGTFSIIDGGGVFVRNKNIWHTTQPILIQYASCVININVVNLSDNEQLGRIYYSTCTMPDSTWSKFSKSNTGRIPVTS